MKYIKLFEKKITLKQHEKVIRSLEYFFKKYCNWAKIYIIQPTDTRSNNGTIIFEVTISYKNSEKIKFLKDIVSYWRTDGNPFSLLDIGLTQKEADMVIKIFKSKDKEAEADFYRNLKKYNL